MDTRPVLAVLFMTLCYGFMGSFAQSNSTTATPSNMTNNMTTPMPNMGNNMTNNMTTPMPNMGNNMTNNMTTPMENMGNNMTNNMTTPMPNMGNNMTNNMTTPMPNMGNNMTNNMTTPMQNMGNNMTNNMTTPMPNMGNNMTNNMTTPMQNMGNMTNNMTTPMQNMGNNMTNNMTTPMQNMGNMTNNMTTPMPNMANMTTPMQNMTNNMTTPMQNMTNNMTTPMPNMTNNMTTARPAGTTAAPAVVTNTTVTALPNGLSRTGCGTTKVCGSEPSNCNPSATSQCFFFSANQVRGQDFGFEVSAQSEGYVALTLSTDTTLGGNDTTYVCANNNGSVQFFSTLLDNGNLTVTELPVTSVRGSVNGTRISCTFTATVPDTSTRAAGFSAAVSTGPFNPATGRLGSPTAALQTPVIDLTNVNATANNTITSTTAAPATTAHGVTLKQSLMQALLVTVGVLCLTVL